MTNLALARDLCFFGRCRLAALFRALQILADDRADGLDQDDGDAVIEVEDKAFESCREDILKSIRLSKRYLNDFIM